MKTLLRYLRQATPCLCTTLLIALTACTTDESAARSAKGQLVKEAGEYASDLRAQGKLPGFKAGEHGREIAEAAWNGGQVSYPATVTVRAWKHGDDGTYCYTLVKDTPAAAWQLTDATHLDKAGRLVEELLRK
jgi:hypothetical protein